MTTGFLYIACGAESFLREAYTSVASLKRHSPDAHATLVCDAIPAALPSPAPGFDAIVTQPIEPIAGRRSLPHAPGLAYKVRHMYAHSRYERTCFLDSDTYLLADIRPLFDVLDYFDMAMSLAPADVTPTRAGGRDLVGCTPYSSGVILFRKSELTERLFERWRYWHERAFEEPDFTGADQATLMRALLDVPCRVCTLQNTWNARTPVYERFSGPVRLIHGRHADFEAIARAINVTTAVRVWIPTLNVCIYDGMTWPQHLAYGFRRIWSSWRRWLRRLPGRGREPGGQRR